MKIYKCNICGNIVVMLDDKGVIPNCCGDSMTLLEAGVSDGKTEYHVPAVAIDRSKVTVSIGAEPHPMTDEHYIEWILLETNTGFHVTYLKDTDLNGISSLAEKAVACFKLSDNECAICAYAYCNRHGLWKKELDGRCA